MNERHKSCGAHRKSDRRIGERVVRSMRTECLDEVVINERHLHARLAEYVNYYNLDRLHRSLGLQSPLPRSPNRDGTVVRRPVLGGLHHVYARAAFKDPQLFRA